MCSAGLKFDLHHRNISVVLNHFIVRDALFTIGDNCKSMILRWMAINWSIDRSFSWIHMSLHQCMISFFDIVIPEHIFKFEVCPICLCHNH